MKNNPNKANQFVADPRQSLFLANYLDPKSETFSNAYQSAIRAGYEKEYAEVITGQMPKWLSESLRDEYLIAKAEENLKEFIEMDGKNTAATKSGEVYDFVDPQLLKIKQDTTKFVAERLNKKKYSIRQEVSGPNGEAIEVTIVEDSSLRKTDSIDK